MTSAMFVDEEVQNVNQPAIAAAHPVATHLRLHDGPVVLLFIPHGMTELIFCTLKSK